MLMRIYFSFFFASEESYQYRSTCVSIVSTRLMAIDFVEQEKVYSFLSLITSGRVKLDWCWSQNIIISIVSLSSYLKFPIFNG